jgi:hypothetical protein
MVDVAYNSLHFIPCLKTVVVKTVRDAVENESGLHVTSFLNAVLWYVAAHCIL